MNWPWFELLSTKSPAGRLAFAVADTAGSEPRPAATAEGDADLAG
jgi:hypothetical protein